MLGTVLAAQARLAPSAFWFVPSDFCSVRVTAPEAATPALSTTRTAGCAVSAVPPAPLPGWVAKLRPAAPPATTENGALTAVPAECVAVRV